MIAGGVILAGATVAIVDQLWCLRQLDAEAFVQQAHRIEKVSSFEATRYIGTTSDRAYLQVWTAGRWQDIVYWTQLSELPPDLSAKLEAGQPPWKSWMDRKAETAGPPAR